MMLSINSSLIKQDTEEDCKTKSDLIKLNEMYTIKEYPALADLKDDYKPKRLMSAFVMTSKRGSQISDQPPCMQTVVTSKKSKRPQTANETCKHST